MKTFIEANRASGILAHISSLPSHYGIGDIGPSSYAFIDFLHRSKQRYWQFLPIGVTDGFFGDSPYMCNSAFAGNPLLISPDLMIESGFLHQDDLSDLKDFSPYSVDYTAVRDLKNSLLEKSFQRLRKEQLDTLSTFFEYTPWLRDYALFMALKKHFGTIAWNQWPEKIARRFPEAIHQYTAELKDSIRYFCYEQYLFSTQWHQLRIKAQEKNIKLFGDIPVYVSYDSADVWANQEIFELHPETLLPIEVAGVPPDYFSATGQKWGNPLYRWNAESTAIKKHLLKWWTNRLRTAFEQHDTIRIDHFRGFESYWAIPAENDTAEEGTWKNGPGAPFFEHIFSQLGSLEIVAEDLGIITHKVTQLRNELGFPGMKVLQFAFDGQKNNVFLPYNYSSRNCVVYTGTHDNETSVGWFFGDNVNDQMRAAIRTCCNRNPDENSSIHSDLIYLAYSSIAGLAVVPLQDILGFGNDCRMNTPGKAHGNWLWRCSPEYLTDGVANWLSDLSQRFNRC